LLQRKPFAPINLGRCSVDMGKPLGRKEMVEVFGFVVNLVLQYVGDVIVDAREAGFRRTALGFLIKLIAKTYLVHGSSLGHVHSMIWRTTSHVTPKRHGSEIRQYRSA